MGSFLELFEELTKVSREALNCDSSIPGDGKIEDIYFSFGPPRRGRLSFYKIRNESKYLFGNMRDCYPVFPTLAALKAHLQANPIQDYLLLVKGSHSMHMEELVELL